MNIRWLCIASGIILMLAIIPSWEYSYYILLRWAIFISSIIVAIGFYNSKITGWALVFGAIAFLFNPIFPVYLSRQMWTPIDFISAVLFFIAAYSKKK
jgi:hypothetical protein